jgi:LysR family transcriptional activator of nhaA
LTEVGRVVYRYAEDIFGLGRELQDVLKGRPRGRPQKLVAGVSDLLPKFIAYRVLRPLLEPPEPVQLVCQEDTPERLVVELAEHRLDVVLSDSPLDPSIRVKAYSHLLGSCPVALFAAPSLARGLKKNFPACLDEAPFLLPMEASTLRRSLDHWFDTIGIRPRLVGEFKDSALMKTFGESGCGVFAAPMVIEAEIRAHYSVTKIGVLPSVVERFYAISVERKIKHPAVLRISESAKGGLFSGLLT